MFKRIKTFLFGNPERGGIAPPPPPEYDFSKPFKIVVPVVVEVPLGPIESFSERAQKALMDELAVASKTASTAMFHPLPTGKLKVFIQEAGKKETVN